MERFPQREEDSWFSDEQIGAVARADDADSLRSPIPTSMVSNGEYMPFAQTTQQKEIEARLTDIAEHASHKLGISRRRFLATTGGMAAAFVAMNDVFGRFFDVDPAEIFEPAAVVFARGVKDYPENFEARYNLALANIALQRFDGARAALDGLTELSKEQAADLATAISELTMSQQGLQATLAVGARISQLNILDYLK